MALNRDMGPIARLPSLGELPAAVLHALPAPRTPLEVADIPHQVGLHEARMRHALLCMAAAEGGDVHGDDGLSAAREGRDAPARLYAPQPWKENARRRLHMEGVPPTHTVGEADMGKLVVLEGAEYWFCVRVDKGGLEWVVVTASRLRRQQSKGPACYRVLRECLRSMGPMCRAYRCTTGDVPQAPAVFVEVAQPPRVPGQDVWPVAPSNMWQVEHAAAMCRALQGQATALPKAPVAQSSSNRLAASLALLHGGSRAWCWVVVALEPHSSALRVYERGENTMLTVRSPTWKPCTSVSSVATGARRCISRGPGWARPRSVSAGRVEAMPYAWSRRRTWRRGSERSPRPGGRLRATRRSSLMRGAAGWRSSFPWKGCCTCRNRPLCRRLGPQPPQPVAKAVLKAAPKPPTKKGLPDQYGNYTNIRYVLRHFGGELATEQRGSKELNICPWSKPEGAGHCSWRAGKKRRPAHLQPKDLLDHLARDHGSDPAQRDQAMAMIKSVMLGGLAGPFASAQARSKALALPAGARPAGEHGASPSATSSGARGSAAVSSAGSTGAGASGAGTARSSAVSRGTHPATAPSTGGREGVGVWSCDKLFGPAARARRGRSPSLW